MNFIRSLRSFRLRNTSVIPIDRSCIYPCRTVLSNVAQTRAISFVNSRLFSQQISISSLNRSSDSFNFPLLDGVESESIVEENITVIGEGAPKAVSKFNDIEWPEEVLKVIKNRGYTTPTAIQANSWPVVLSGRDLVGVAKTGCGKTLAFMMPAISQIIQQINKEDRKENSPFALILAPTRELCQQIYDVAKQFRNVITSLAVFGGASKIPQINFIRERNPELIIATPGRLIDLVMTGSVDTSQVKYLVLDEADRMLDMGFEPQIRQIVRNIPEERQTVMFSATWPTDVKELANDFLNNFIQINVGSTELFANPNITQNIEVLEFGSFNEKKNRLIAFLEQHNGDKVIIFVETKAAADNLARWLTQWNGIRALALHGDKSQAQRDRIMKDFRDGRRNILVATDVASRGIDVSDIKHVINFDFPRDIEDYVHRIGRTARANETGNAYSFFTQANVSQGRDLIKILKQANQKVPEKLEQMVQNARFEAMEKRRKYVRSNNSGNFEFNFKRRNDMHRDSRPNRNYRDRSLRSTNYQRSNDY